MFQPRPNTLFAGGMFIALMAMAILLPAAARSKTDATAAGSSAITGKTATPFMVASFDVKGLGLDLTVEAETATATPSAIPPTATAIGTPTPTAIGQSPRNAGPTPTIDIYASTQCYVAPIPWDNAWGTQDTNVYSGPGRMYAVVGSLGIWEYIPATGYYTQENYDRWIRVDYYGAEGWVNGGTYAYSPACTDNDPDDDIPFVPVNPPPPTWTPTPLGTPSYYTLTPSPTAISGTAQSNGGTNYYSYTITGESNVEHQMVNTLPGSDGATTHVVTISIIGLSPTDPQGEDYHNVSVGLWCEIADYLRFNFYGEAPTWECGRYLTVYTYTETHEIQLILQVPEGAPPQTYTVWVNIDWNQ